MVSETSTGALYALCPDSGVDVLAVLSLVGTLAVGEYLAGAVIGVMLATMPPTPSMKEAYRGLEEGRQAVLGQL